MKIALVAIASVALAVGLYLPSRGPDPDAVPTVEQVLARTMSPFCPGLTLDECPSTQAVAVRDEIEQRVNRGQTNRQIDAWLVANFGEGALGRPEGISSWIVPAVALLIGAGIVTAMVSRTRTPRPEEPLEPADASRLARDIRSYQAGNE